MHFLKTQMEIVFMTNTQCSIDFIFWRISKWGKNFLTIIFNALRNILNMFCNYTVILKIKIDILAEKIKIGIMKSLDISWLFVISEKNFT